MANNGCFTCGQEKGHNPDGIFYVNRLLNISSLVNVVHMWLWNFGTYCGLFSNSIGEKAVREFAPRSGLSYLFYRSESHVSYRLPNNMICLAKTFKKIFPSSFYEPSIQNLSCRLQQHIDRPQEKESKIDFLFFRSCKGSILRWFDRTLNNPTWRGRDRMLQPIMLSLIDWWAYRNHAQAIHADVGIVKNASRRNEIKI